MSEGLSIELQDQALLRAVDQALQVLEHPRELMDAIGAQIEANAELRFDSKTDPTGAAWAPLSPATIDIYQSEWFIQRNEAFKGGIPGSLLVRTNQLRSSLTHNTGDAWVDIGTSRRVPGKKQPTWQVGLLHEFGTVKMPRRGLLTANPSAGTLGAEDEADVLRIVNQAISGAWS